MLYINREHAGKVWFVLVLVCAARWSAAADVARVRSTDASLNTVIKEGSARSSTFRAIVARIDQSDGIVYVEYGYCAFGHLDGCLLPSIVSNTRERYLRIVVSKDRNRVAHDQTIALIAHELQHAVEVLEHLEVVDLETMTALYRRIGVPLAGRAGYETAAASAVGRKVLAELSAKTQSIHPPPTTVSPS